MSAVASQRAYDNCSFKANDIVEINWNNAEFRGNCSLIPGRNEPFVFLYKCMPFRFMIEDSKGNRELVDAELVLKP